MTLKGRLIPSRPFVFAAAPNWTPAFAGVTTQETLYEILRVFHLILA